MNLAWRCPKAGHVYWATGSNRTQARTNCPICSNRLVVAGINDITTTHPDIAAEIEPAYAAGHPVTSLAAGSELKPRWVCSDCGNNYKMSVYDRTHGRGCEPCRLKKLRAGRDNLAATHPEVAAQWHPSRNNGDEAVNHSQWSKDVVWWLCPTPAAHFYKMRVDRKALGFGCTSCSNRKLVLRVNDLATTDPMLVMEFHPDLNGNKKPELMFASNTAYYWKCLAAGHVNRQNVPNRRKSKGCVDCRPEDRILAN